MRKHSIQWLVLVTTLHVACSGIPVPPDKQDYVGHWEGDGMTLTITADGGVSYVRVSGGGKREINAPIKAFEGNDFVVGALGITTTFKVSKPPYQEADVPNAWKMVVDGIELTRR